MVFSKSKKWLIAQINVSGINKFLFKLRCLLFLREAGSVTRWCIIVSPISGLGFNLWHPQKKFLWKETALGAVVNCLDPQDLGKKPSMVMCIWNPRLGTREKGGSRGTAGQPVLSKPASSRFGERSCLKKSGGECGGETPDIKLCVSPDNNQNTRESFPNDAKPMEYKEEEEESRKVRRGEEGRGRSCLRECQHFETYFQNYVTGPAQGLL